MSQALSILFQHQKYYQGTSFCNSSFPFSSYLNFQTFDPRSPQVKVTHSSESLRFRARRNSTVLKTEMSVNAALSSDFPLKNRKGLSALQTPQYERQRGFQSQQPHSLKGFKKPNEGEFLYTFQNPFLSLNPQCLADYHMPSSSSLQTDCKGDVVVRSSCLPPLITNWYVL